MKIEFVSQYRIISNLTAEKLPDFAVLIGQNGVGKSQIFRALLDGSLTISGITKEEIELYEINSFMTRSSQLANLETSKQTRGLIDAFFNHKSGMSSLKEMSEEIFDNYIDISVPLNDVGKRERDKFVADLRKDICLTPRRGVFGLDGRNRYEVNIRERILGKLKDYELEQLKKANYRNSDLETKNSQYCKILSAAMRKTNKFPHELDRNDIRDAMHYDANLVSNILSQVFHTYKIAQWNWAHEQFEEGKSLTYFDLIQQYEKKFPPPWRVMRDVLTEMREMAGIYTLFDFDFSDPADQELNMENSEFFAFTAEMKNRTIDAKYDLSNLSSGEKILMALCMVSFNQRVGMHTPKLLLLDEVDALLHPSMVKALAKTLKSLFVSKGIPVLMTSHSPMTVATLDDEDVFRVSRTCGHVKISTVNKSDAIIELSEGVATADMGLRIAACEESKVTILTEGNNAKHLKKWSELHYPESVRVFEGLENHTSKNQLLMYGRLLSKMNLNTHFVIVWDCDAKNVASKLRSELVSNSPITPFVFMQRPENTIAKSGIENNYEDSLLQPYAKTISISDFDSDTTKLELDQKHKKKFADYILVNGTREDFIHFQDLNDVIEKILQGMET